MSDSIEINISELKTIHTTNTCVFAHSSSFEGAPLMFLRKNLHLGDDMSVNFSVRIGRHLDTSFQCILVLPCPLAGGVGRGDDAVTAFNAALKDAGLVSSSPISNEDDIEQAFAAIMLCPPLVAFARKEEADWQNMLRDIAHKSAEWEAKRKAIAQGKARKAKERAKKPARKVVPRVEQELPLFSVSGVAV